MSLLSLTLLILSLAPSPFSKAKVQGIRSARLLDLVIRDYTFQSYDKSFRTGFLHTVNLPANLSGITIDTVRFRCGSLRRYGARVKEFHLGIGVNVYPCAERVLLVRQNLGDHWSSIYYDNSDLYGYQLVTPVLGLLAYNAGIKRNSSKPFEIGIFAPDSPITIDFSNISRVGNNTSGLVPLCASFGDDGKATLSNLVSSHLCVTKKHGHYGLVIESPLIQSKKRMSRWKMAVGISLGAAIGAFLLILLLIAVFARVKKKAKLEEMERRAYEEEALQVSMVGHFRAPIAPATRTLPTLEHELRSHTRHH